MKTEVTRHYYNSGQLHAELYHKEDDVRYYHRTDGPAYVRWKKDGNKRCESYWVNGRLHRTDGPARTWWDKDGNVTCEIYYLHNEQYSKEEYDKKINPHPETEEERAGLIFHDLLTISNLGI